MFTLIMYGFSPDPNTPFYYQLITIEFFVAFMAGFAVCKFRKLNKTINN
jgi:hypothetical protein